jgi:hypothetical protein
MHHTDVSMRKPVMVAGRKKNPALQVIDRGPKVHSAA